MVTSYDVFFAVGKKTGLSEGRNPSSASENGCCMWLTGYEKHCGFHPMLI
jgi:hypothetical protein